jgi:glutamine amidotransferase
MEPIALAPWVLDSKNSLREQACGDCHGEVHSDGWGAGWYRPDSPLPQVVHRAADARTDPNFDEAIRPLSARLAIVHVRQGSVGDASLVNCHPFSHGAWLFAHNGTVTNFPEIEPRLSEQIAPVFLARRQGTTDSELVFWWLMSWLAERGLDLSKPAPDVSLPSEAIRTVLRRLAAWSDEFPPHPRTKFNFLLTDGRCLVASRWKHDLSCCALPQGFIIASEPIADKTAPADAWREVPDSSMVLIDAGGRVDFQPV